MADVPAASVLIVDDNPDNRNLLTRLVEKLGHRTVAATNGHEALAQLKTDAFDLVLLDIMMPHMNGHEVLDRMKADAALRDVPVVVVSALTEVDNVVQAVRQGAEDYLFKPINAVLLRSRVQASLEKRRLREAEQAHVLELRREREKVEELLLRLYPPSVVERLKAGETLIADAYPEATILFADISDFGRITASRSPTDVVRLLNQVFSTFDQLCEQHGVEKVKTVADAYMAACGIGNRCAGHASAVADLAMHMQREAMQVDTRLREPFSLRIGIHTGPVVAGVIGTAKGSFDLWGTTVRIASHMEATGLVGGIQVSEATYQRLRDDYLFEERGTFYVRGEGEVTTYMLRGKKGGGVTAKFRELSS